MYNTDVKESIEMFIDYFGGNGIRVREDDVVDVDLSGSDIGSLEELRYLLVVEEVGDLKCSTCKNLRDLRGSPREVRGNFDCFWCSNLESLEGGPSYVEGNFSCRYCKNLKDLSGCPSVVEGNFDCSDCKELISLKGDLSKVYGDFVCSGCKKLREIDFDVKEIGKNLSCVECVMLEYIDERVVEKVRRKIYVKGCKNIRNMSELKEKFGNKIELYAVYYGHYE